jgi:hypothetical protein
LAAIYQSFLDCLRNSIFCFLVRDNFALSPVNS